MRSRFFKLFWKWMNIYKLFTSVPIGVAAVKSGSKTAMFMYFGAVLVN